MPPCISELRGMSLKAEEKSGSCVSNYLSDLEKLKQLFGYGTEVMRAGEC
jgi:hypothetical protein